MIEFVICYIYNCWIRIRRRTRTQINEQKKNPEEFMHPHIILQD